MTGSLSSSYKLVSLPQIQLTKLAKVLDHVFHSNQLFLACAVKTLDHCQQSEQDDRFHGWR